MDFFFYVAVITLLSGSVILFGFILGTRKIKHIKDVSPISSASPPKISIIIPACNEEKDIEKALQSVLDIDYDPIEIIVINDRSTDATGDILDSMVHRYPHLKVVHIKELPPQWIGKNHALDQGARLASGGYLLFTDADVFFEKTILRRAINHMKGTKLDHLALIFGVPGLKGLLGMLILETMVGLFVILKPWKAKEASKRYFVGVGAFNLVRASTYWECGGHHKIAMCPVDDIMLGKLIKQNGFKQDCLYGQEFVLVEWYTTVSEMMAGLMKNSFASFDFSILRVIAASVAVILFGIWPLLSLFVVSGPVFVANSFLVISRLLFGCFLAHTIKMKLIHTLWGLITPYLTLFMIWKAVFSTLYHRGITWRGTRYSLKALRSGIYK